MNNKRLKGIRRTFHDQFIAFYYIKDIHTIIGMMSNRFGKPMTTGFDEFIFMQSGPFFPPAVSFGNRFNLVYQIITGKFCLTFPLDNM